MKKPMKKMKMDHEGMHKGMPKMAKGGPVKYARGGMVRGFGAAMKGRGKAC